MVAFLLFPGVRSYLKRRAGGTSAHFLWGASSSSSSASLHNLLDQTSNSAMSLLVQGETFLPHQNRKIQMFYKYVHPSSITTLYRLITII